MTFRIICKHKPTTNNTMTVLTTIDALNEVYDRYKDNFRSNQCPSFHNLLWQIIVNESTGCRLVVFTPVYHNNMLQVSITTLNETGHRPTNVEFAAGTTYDKAVDVCYALNRLIFGITDLLADRIVAISMAGTPQEVKQ
jgi:hypothetical protein